MNHTPSARALGWVSVGIALAEIFAPGKLERMLGVSNHQALLRSMGFRELASGLSILASPTATGRPTPAMAAGVWSRVAGDLLDLALLGAAAKETRRPASLATAAAMVLGVTVLDYIVARQMPTPAFSSSNGRHKPSPN